MRSESETPEARFPARLAALRTAADPTQQALADRIGVHVVQLRRYESGSSQPTLEVIRRMAVALGVSADCCSSPKTSAAPTTS